MFKVTNKTIYLTRGDSALFRVRAVDKQKGVYRPHVDDVLTLTVKRSIDDSQNALQINAIDFDETGWDMYIPPELTKQLSFGDYVYDIQLKTCNGWVTTIVTPSKFIIGKEVTV